MTTKSLRSVWLATALLLPVLAGCSRQEPEAPAATENTVSDVAPAPEPVAIDPAPTPTPTPSPTPVNPDAEPIAADEQMMDDAAATGMTARSERSRDEAADEGSTVEDVEAK